MLTLTSLRIWLHCKQPASGGFSIAGRGNTGFTGSSRSGLAGSMLAGVDVASLVAENQDSLRAGMKHWISLRWSLAGSGGSGFAGSSGSGFVSSRESEFALMWRKALDLASLPQL